jgi:hypothetical protein
MNEETEMWKAFKADSKRNRTCDRQARAEKNIKTIDHAIALASANGMRLIVRSTFLQIEPIDRAWLLNLYPTNGRLYADQNRLSRPPYLDLPDQWCILDVVKKLIELKK